MNRERTGFAVSWSLPVDSAESWDTGGLQEQYPYLKTSEPFCSCPVSQLGAASTNFPVDRQPRQRTANSVRSSTTYDMGKTLFTG